MGRHVHADLMIEAAENTSIKWQWSRNEVDYRDCSGYSPDWNPDLKYRKKPREFKEGHWYPMTDKEDDSCVKLFSDGDFYSYTDLECPCPIDEFKWIGESLGELKFGE